MVGAAIREARLSVGINQAALAQRLGVSPAYVHKLEAGRGNPTLGMLARVARALDAELTVGFRERHQATTSSPVELLTR
jgi:transcriptional regulator with XRE-family HTH domain